MKDCFQRWYSRRSKFAGGHQREGEKMMAEEILHFEITESHDHKVKKGLRLDVSHKGSRSLNMSVAMALAEELNISKNAALTVLSHCKYEEC
jgi:hypothetical protein